MFDHMVKVNKLQSSFKKYGLTKNDLIFIKELIAGAASDGGGDQVPKSKTVGLKK